MAAEHMAWGFRHTPHLQSAKTSLGLSNILENHNPEKEELAV
jgi:hypothetical protein